MVHNYTICPVTARCDQLWPHLTQHSQFWSIFDNCDWKGYIWHMSPVSGIYCIVMASTCPVIPVVGNGGQLLSRISSLNELVLFKAELRDLGLVNQVIACTAVWDMFGQISSKVAYNGPVFVTVSWYDSFGLYLPLHYLFWAVLSLSVRLGRNRVKVQCKRESSQKRSIILQYETLQWDMTNYGHICHRISNTDQFSTSAPEEATYDLWRQLMAYTAR